MLEQWHQAVDGVYDQMVTWRRYLHENPELSFKEENTARMVADILSGYGIAVRRNVGGHGVVGTLKGSKSGPTIALRADMDALPIQQENDVPYKSQVPGVMHACGHDAHTATLLGVAKILSQHKNELNGTVIFIFQPAEEHLPGGAISMIEDGALDGVDLIFGNHVLSTLKIGQFTAPKGKATSSMDAFEITIHGKGGHSASPQTAANPIIIGVQLINQIQLLASQKIRPTETATITITTFQAGGILNVIPQTAKLSGTIRSYREEVRTIIEDCIRQVTQTITTIYGGKYELNYQKGYPSIYNHPKETDTVRKVLSEIEAAELVDMSPLMASEDFAYYTQKIPGAFFFTGSSNENENTQVSHHHSKFDIDETSMKFAAKAFLSIVHHYLVKS